ncbi:MAG: ORF6N domain-containing protein, partial [Verrucomicrobiota bacterium]
MNKQTEIIPAHNITGLIHSVRDARVILDSDLARLYEVSTKRLNEQFRRNLDRFPDDFAFQLTEEEWLALRSQIATLKT